MLFCPSPHPLELVLTGYPFFGCWGCLFQIRKPRLGVFRHLLILPSMHQGLITTFSAYMRLYFPRVFAAKDPQKALILGSTCHALQIDFALTQGLHQLQAAQLCHVQLLQRRNLGFLSFFTCIPCGSPQPHPCGGGPYSCIFLVLRVSPLPCWLPANVGDPSKVPHPPSLFLEVRLGGNWVEDQPG